MASTQALRRRIRSISNTRQITKAMELVAAAKMRRVQSAVERARIYSDSAISIMQNLASTPEAKNNPYFQAPESKSSLYIIITSDSGLAGAYNANILNMAHKSFMSDRAKGLKPKVIAIGRKGAHHFSHIHEIELIGEYENVADDPEANVFAPIIERVAEGITAAEFSAVTIIFTEFRSSLIQQARSLELVPINPSQQTTETENARQFVFEFEPDTETVLDEAIRVYMESALRRTRVEAATSEHAMRMLSMSNANRNAGDLIDNLKLELNATRQAAITQEMAEIIGGAEAIA